MADLTARLLDPETFEKRLDFFMKVQLWDSEKQEMAAAIRQLHARLATAKADLDRKDRTIISLEELRRETEYVHSERIKEKEILAYDTGKELEAALDALATAKAEGAAEAYEDIKAQAEDLRKAGGMRAGLLRLLTEECIDRAAVIRKGIEAKEGK